MHVQVVGQAVCRFEHRGFKRAEKRWDSASLRARDFKGKQNCGSLSKEV
jgi:hypothetical protein